jgi:hypothetical protein
MATPEDPVAADDPPRTIPPGASILNKIQARVTGITAAVSGLLVLATIPLFISFSTTQIKELFDQFTGGCLLVLDKRTSPGGHLFVTGQIAGTMPAKLPLIFEGRDALINTIEFVDAYRFEQILEPDDLSFHPLTNLQCPGPLCEKSGDEHQRRTVQIMLTDLRPEFTLRFDIRMIPNSLNTAAVPNNLKVYAAFDPGFEGPVCRVQPRRWFNFWVWATPLKKAFLFICVILIGGLMVKWAQSERGSKS